MLILKIVIPPEFVDDYIKDHFRNYFERVKADTEEGFLCGRYEQEITEMLEKAFEKAHISM